MENMMIEVKNELIGKELVQAVNARDLWAKLESKQDFSTWIKKRVADYGFVENQDFTRFHKKKEANNATMTEYIIALDMAKELAMMEKTEQGFTSSVNGTLEKIFNVFRTNKMRICYN